MTDDEWKKRLSRARTFAFLAGARTYEQAEDFAQDYAVGLLEGRSTNLRYAYVDYLRKHYGRFENSRQKRILIGYKDCVSHREITANHTFDPTDPIFHKELKRLLRRLTPYQQYAVEGFMNEVSYDHMARELKVSKSRVCQLIKEGIDKLREWIPDG